jgi:Staphylococcal protein of unknown function (DUF960).
MFHNARYLTRGVQNDVPFDIQLVLWSLIEELGSMIELDYLQVFKLQAVEMDGQTLQSVEHSQEQPKYKEKSLFRVSKLIDITVWAIDDGDHSTMLLPDEY